MPTRLAGIMALIVFAVCLLIGGIQAGNTFDTAVVRALVAMGGTFVVAWVIGAMGKKMIQENLRQREDAVKKSEVKPAPAADK